MKINKFFAFCFLLFAFCFFEIGLISCTSRKHIEIKLDAEDEFRLAKERFEKKDYTEASARFKAFTLNYPQSPVAAEAQYYLAESYFQLKDHLSAEEEYARLVNDFPTTPFAEQGQFGLGLCYWRQSPHYSRDPTMTEKAIQAFQAFIYRFPQSDLLPKVEDLLSKCQEKLAHKDYENGRLYLNLKQYQSALIYFQDIIKEYPQTRWAKDARFGVAMAKEGLNRIEEAKDEYQKIIEEFKGESIAKKAEKRLKSLRSPDKIGTK
ncbi:MAG: outer membrane protein assembly factor BamD [Candidatus Edwardsbacteria bacterium]